MSGRRRDQNSARAPPTRPPGQQANISVEAWDSVLQNIEHLRWQIGHRGQVNRYWRRRVTALDLQITELRIHQQRHLRRIDNLTRRANEAQSEAARNAIEAALRTEEAKDFKIAMNRVRQITTSSLNVQTKIVGLGFTRFSSDSGTVPNHSKSSYVHPTIQRLVVLP